MPEWVMDANPSPTAVVVYLHLARFANNRDRSCYPSKNLIARLSGLHVNTVTKAIHELEDLGAVTIKKRTYEGMQTSNLYVLHMIGPHGTPADYENPIKSAITNFVPPTPPNFVPPTPPNFGEGTIQSNHTRGTRSLSSSSDDDGLFDQFWDIYPRKIGKGTARAAFKKALRKTDFQTMLSGAEKYAAAREGQDKNYTAHPATWLNGERWSDEDPPTSPSKPGTMRDREIDFVQQAMQRIKEAPHELR